ncbi:methylated-DNA--[protein]-cysteine S-methyltransferase [Erysipelothrix sp. HDW6C]|uniref:methylated-DNA--[protein]-cysteine S-methyltransferase n=1 Tax=Erysipelothrix sp. HDW6C TaxID=2714930 RepID=UPI001408D035|nr:methylated-DNA--[protein]-cysteine S-methyltransferase [Erysipelothrix sp. HDW6C]QIK69470.1 methylated-DNA--[protein]-cysteine S-methyltransferase [Erysipelothrix sp. HDW6C]
MFQYTYQFTTGEYTITERDGAIIAIESVAMPNQTEFETPLIKKCAQEIREYLLGKRIEFTVPYRLEGTDFQIEVWKAIAAIPYGETRSYRSIAEQVGRPRAARAVGTACNRCRLSYLIPCQRVLSSQGLGGYGDNISEKVLLLNLEASTL